MPDSTVKPASAPATKPETAKLSARATPLRRLAGRLAALLVALTVALVGSGLSAPWTPGGAAIAATERAGASAPEPTQAEAPATGWAGTAESYHQETFAPAGAPDPPDVTASSAVVMDVASGRILLAKDADRQLAPASLTKVMTCLLALEAGGLDETVEITDTAASVGGSSVWLGAGEKQTLRSLLYGLMLRSGNDAAEAIAEHIAGNAGDFALLMNRRAVEIGATATHFRNPHGLPEPGHRTTAADLALIVREALLRPDFRQIVATRRYVIPWPGQPWDRAVYNENRLLWLYPGADGVKTGWTEEAGRCLIGSATREGWQLVAVVLDAPEMWTDVTQLLDWAFSSFRRLELYRAGDEVARARLAGAAERWVPLATTRDVAVAVLPGEEGRVMIDPDPPLFVRSPLARGQEVGSLRLAVEGEPLRPLPLVAAEAVPAGGLVGHFLEDLWVLLRATLQRLLGR